MKTLKVFVSSPGDVGREREISARVLNRLAGEFVGRVDVQSYFWEHEPMRATRDFQDQIPSPSTFDIVLCILWSRLGSRLHSRHNRADGTPYLSGTEYEFEDAAAAAFQRGVPELLVYFNKTPKTIPAEPIEVRQQMIEQFDALRAFEKRWFVDSAEKALKAAFNTYTDLDRFEEMVETHLRKILADQMVQDEDSSVAPRVPLWTSGSPFRGLEPFEVEHEVIFFGRTRAVGEVLEALRKQSLKGCAFVLVLGMSGCGKSSLIKAGVLPLLTRPGVVEGIGLWRWAIFRPADATGDLFDGLATALLRVEALPELASDGTPKEQLAEMLRKAPGSVIALIKGGLSQAAREIEIKENLVQQPAARLALVIDQLEEMFTLETVTHQQRADFIAVLAALARSGRVFVLSTLRSDYYARCADEPQLVELKAGSGTYHLLPPSALEIGQIVRQPAFAAGLHFEQDPQTQEQLDDLIRDAAVRDPQALPLVQFTLQALYERRKANGRMTLEAYRSLGGVEGAVAARAEQTYNALSGPARDSFPAVARALVRVGEGAQAVRQRAAMSQFDSDPAACELIAAFVQERLFVTDHDDVGIAIVSVAHEALLSAWERFAAWIRENRDFLLARTRLEQASSVWEAANRDAAYLLQPGRPLEQAAFLLRHHGTSLSGLARSFVETSIQAVEAADAEKARARLREARSLQEKADALWVELRETGNGQSDAWRFAHLSEIENLLVDSLAINPEAMDAANRLASIRRLLVETGIKTQDLNLASIYLQKLKSSAIQADPNLPKLSKELEEAWEEADPARNLHVQRMRRWALLGCWLPLPWTAGASGLAIGSSGFFYWLLATGGLITVLHFIVALFVVMTASGNEKSLKWVYLWSVILIFASLAALNPVSLVLSVGVGRRVDKIRMQKLLWRNAMPT